MAEIWGHRGAYDFAPENTLESFSLAADMGADGVELDIQLTKDGKVVVIHDETVERVSDGHGYVKDLTLSELKRLNFNKRGLTLPYFMEIPTLAEVFELLSATGLQINIELKTGIVYYEGIEQKALALAGQHGMSDRIVWSSFNHWSVQNVKRIEPSAKTALLCGGGILATGEECERTGAEALHPDVRQFRFPGLVEDCHRRGVKVRPFTVNSPEDLRAAYEIGVDGVFTNNIIFAKAERRAHGEAPLSVAAAGTGSPSDSHPPIR